MEKVRRYRRNLAWVLGFGDDVRNGTVSCA